MYNYRHHPYADIHGQPSQAPATVSFFDPPPAANTTTAAGALTNGTTTTQTQQPTNQPANPNNDDEIDKRFSDEPHSAAEHTASLRELAQGLVLKEQQIEYLIQSLPGIGSSERDQERRIRELQEELRVVEQERAEKEVLREGLVEGLGKWIMGGRRVP